MTEPLANSPHGGREPLIPIRRARLAELLAEKGGLSDEETRLWSNLTRDIGSAVHARFRERLERLKEAYAGQLKMWGWRSLGFFRFFCRSVP